jgi:hypothetical protein
MVLAEMGTGSAKAIYLRKWNEKENMGSKRVKNSK